MNMNLKEGLGLIWAFSPLFVTISAAMWVISTNSLTVTHGFAGIFVMLASGVWGTIRGYKCLRKMGWNQIPED